MDILLYIIPFMIGLVLFTVCASVYFDYGSNIALVGWIVGFFITTAVCLKLLM